MAHTKVTKTYSQNTGTANTFSYSGSFDVFKGTEVVVLLDGTTLTFTSSTINESASPREYTVDVSAKTIHIGGADLSSGTIVIRPETDMGAPTPRATYAPGASVASEDLNNNQLQLMRKAMEYDETKMSTTGDTMTGNLTMGEDTTVIFEGATDDGYETTLTVTDPTADRTITLPNVTGTVITTGDTGSIATAMIAADAITNAKIADNALDSEHYTDGSIDAAHLASSSVTTAKLASDAVTGAKIADDAIDSEHIAADSIDAEHYAAGSVDTTALGADAVTGAKIADDAIDSEHYTDGSIDTAHIADSQVTTAKIADNAVTFAKIGCEQTTISDTDTSIPTSGAVVDYVSAQITPLGGFEAIADEDNFPTTIPIAGVIVSIADATGVTVNGSGTSTTARTAGNGSDNVTINNFPSSLYSATLPNNTGLLVISTGSSHTYNFHRLLPTTDDVKQLSDDVNDFFARYRIASSAPGSNNDAGDLYFNTSNNTLYVYNGSAWVAGVSSTPGTDSVDSDQIATGAVDLEHMSSESVDEDNLHISNAGSNGQFLSKQSGNSGGLTWATPSQSTPTDITVADESSDTTCFPLFVTAATGDLEPKSGSNLTFNSNTGALGATSFTGDGSALTGIAGAPAGSVTMWAGAAGSIPTGYLLCNGQTVSRSTYSGLFSAIGTTYGAGDGSSTFEVPNLSSKFIAGYNASDGSYDIGDTGGNASVNSSTSGSHQYTGSEDNPNQVQGASSSINGINNKQSNDRHAHGLDWTHNHSVATLPPFMALAYIIKT